MKRKLDLNNDADYEIFIRSLNEDQDERERMARYMPSQYKTPKRETSG